MIAEGWWQIWSRSFATFVVVGETDCESVNLEEGSV